MHRLQDYWKTGPLFRSVFPDYMSRDRFLLILRYLHFTNNKTRFEDDRLYKIRFVIDYFNNKMANIYYPGKELSLDESMVLWRGCLIFRQYIKNKRHKYGVKIYTLTEPNGLVLNCIVYTGKTDDLGGKGHTSKVVLHLMEGKENNGHALYMDNFYNSHDLAKNLIEKGTYVTGTIQSNRINNPLQVVKPKLAKSETTCKYSEHHIMIGK
uniref:PiggyBac transposable element-derived protein domain-containing protein n=1 Tax=Clastoptera arizonana TaxID=38151 RepID=A0A1B6DQT5_9HEMI